MTKDQYYSLMEQLGNTPVESEVPPDLTDFPYFASQAYDIFNKLGDRHLATSTSVMYLGKDLSTFDMLCNVYEVDPENKASVLDFITIIDKHAIKKANRKKGKK
jgi:hypothetical protein